MFVGDGEVIATYMSGPDREPMQALRPFGDDSALTKVLRDRVTLAFDDQSNIPDEGFGQSIEAARLVGIRSSVFAPMSSDGPPVGVAAFRLTVDPFTDEEIELLQTFAVQAGNAVTNARLLADIDQRNAELAEALELQTASAEVLRLIGEHPGERDAVLQGILRKAAELCGGEAGSITLVEGDDHRFVASYGPAMEPYLGTLMESTEGRRAEQFGSLDDRVFSVDDFMSVADGWTTYFSDMARTGNVRSYAFAPLTTGDQLVGRLHMFRHEVRPFSASELERLGSFAAQASLAIGNAQLFNDLDRGARTAAGDDRRSRSGEHGTVRHPARLRPDRRTRRPPVRPHRHPDHDSRSGGAECRGRCRLGRTRPPGPRPQLGDHRHHLDDRHGVLHG